VWSVDSTSISYVAWSSHDGGTAENCMSLNVNNGTWSDNNCANLMAFVCGKLIIIIIIVTSYAPISSKIELSGATKPRD